MAETAASPTAADKNLAARVSPARQLAEAFAAGSLAGTVELKELPFLTMVGLRAQAGSDTAQRLAAVTGGLPAGVGAVDSSGDTSVLWLGPGEFLVVAPTEAHESLGGGLIPALRDALGDGAGQVVDLSANRTTFELSGPRARAVLEKGCSLDLHPRVFKAGTAYSTEIANIPAILWKTGEDSFRIFPRASFAEFLGRWLLDAMREYASPEVP
ncbi:sarcosine oxidase subunit gamma family protein [Arthrobacter sp. FX8]|jgi:sarcosine oxidase subunit gamma|uniref:sarcosine oxidase subunit gamma n=1 Tax=unclassified Arthrobacter TaxID=235627 RepID=UPI00119DF5EE|nr:MULTISPECIES: sarcosine oxidase subunit gamma family protein [unclassified Arthrobacter]TWD54812.1 sarcosine oxidase subunit gamma [Arthrobacter sp. AG367]WAJ32523.1 sarcosine oxidase subunit gamma family protein [Arthrobacter sp. FX8]